MNQEGFGQEIAQAPFQVKEEYMSVIPVKTAEEIDRQTITPMPGRRWIIGSLVCAALALGFAPVLFGLLGVVAGTVAVWKGGRWWGTAGVSGSAVAAVVGYYWAGGLIT